MPQRILLMRHAEKPDDPTDPDLSPQGKGRANRLATYIPRTFVSIGWLFAAASSKHSVRPIETITPLSQAIHVPINQDIADQDYSVLADHLLRQPTYTGATVLVCWHHGHLPDLAEALGVPPAEVGERWDPAVSDLIWELDFAAANPAPSLTSITEPF